MDADARVKRQVEYSEACQVDIYTVTRNVGPVCVASYRIATVLSRKLHVLNLKRRKAMFVTRCRYPLFLIFSVSRLDFVRHSWLTIRVFLALCFAFFLYSRVFY